MTDPSVSILLVNWNTRDMTLACLRSIYAQTTRTSFEVIVVDNGSSDGSAEAIALEFPQAILMAEKQNHGFGRATNLQAQRARGKQLLLLNTDTVVLDHAIDALVEFSRRTPHARIWGGRTLFADGSLNPTSCWGKPTPWTQFCQAVGIGALFPGSPFFNRRAYPGWARDSERAVDIVTGCLLLIDTDFWHELGGFDPAFFMYGEEADLCLRAARRGARPMITPAATIIHYDGGSTQGSAEKLTRTLAATVRMIEKHFPAGTRAASRLLLYGGTLLRSLAYSLSERLRPGKHGRHARLWREVWLRRKEWQAGFR